MSLAMEAARPAAHCPNDRPSGHARSRRRHGNVRPNADYAAQKRVPRALVVETALVSLLSPDGADRLEAALARRRDRMTRQIERLERHVTISNEALAAFVRFWLTSTPPLPDVARAAAQTKGRERYEGFVESLGRRLERRRKLADEISRDFDAVAPEDGAEPRCRRQGSWFPTTALRPTTTFHVEPCGPESGHRCKPAWSPSDRRLVSNHSLGLASAIPGLRRSSISGRRLLRSAIGEASRLERAAR
jgi:hypothetical protein